MRMLWLAALSTTLLAACGGGGGTNHQGSANDSLVESTTPTNESADDEAQSEAEQTGDITEGQPSEDDGITLVRDIGTEYFEVTNAGFHRESIDETHGEWFYPGPEDLKPAGRFVLSPGSAVPGDFNGDGHEDFAIIWTIVPHTLPRETVLGPSIFINDKNGGFEPENSNVEGSTPLRHKLYRSHAADFNDDGRDDLLMGSMGLVFQTPEEQRYEWEPIGYMLSNDSGMLEDASHLIEGQENGDPPENYNFAHDLAVGDFNGDGYLDFYAGKALFFNRGDGSFENRSELLPGDARRADFAMSSVGADFDNDGIDDLAVAWADPSAERYLFLSNDRGISEAKTVRLPDGTFGVDNTISNYMSAGDINNDGLTDIIIAETRGEPYYVGRHIQILVNSGDGNFVDETEQRVDNEPFDGQHGEGELVLADLNNDNSLDIVHAAGGAILTGGGTHIYINSGSGSFYYLPTCNIPVIDNADILGFGSFGGSHPPERSFPIDIDKEYGIDFITYKQLPREYTSDEPDELFLFSLESTKAIPAVSVDGFTVAADCP